MGETIGGLRKGKVCGGNNANRACGLSQSQPSRLAAKLATAKGEGDSYLLK